MPCRKTTSGRALSSPMLGLATVFCLNLGCVPLAITPANPDAVHRRTKISLADDDGFHPPGWLDLGLGIGAAFNTTAGNDDDVVGALLSVKAYPFGRWYTWDAHGEIRPIRERDDLLHRMSLLYGVSLGEFFGSDIRGPVVHVLGASFDVAPHIAVVNGISLFEEERKSGNDTDFAFYFGVSLNLNAFRSLPKALFGSPSGNTEPVAARDPSDY